MNDDKRFIELFRESFPWRHDEKTVIKDRSTLKNWKEGKLSDIGMTRQLKEHNDWRYTPEIIDLEYYLSTLGW